MSPDRKRFLAVSGSLRAGWSNTAMLRAAASLDWHATYVVAAFLAGAAG